MQFDSSTPRRDITVNSVIFSVIQPYSPGHPLSATEAPALNTALADSFRTGFRDSVSDAIEKGNQEENARASEALQAEMDAYMAEYEFGRRPGRSSDPVMAMMRQIATKVVRKRLRERGDKLADYSHEDISKLVNEVIETSHDRLRAKAESAIASEAALLADIT